MQSPPPPPPPSPPLHLHHHHNYNNNNNNNNHHLLLFPLLATIATILSLLIILLILLSIFLHRKLSLSRTTPNPTNLQRFSFSLLRRATSSFSPSTHLGHGGFGSVYRATLPGPAHLAVKLMDPNNSLQGESEFHNELSIASSLSSPFVLSLLGFSSNRKRDKLALVYEYMPNKSLQDALLDKKHEQLMEWNKRFSIAVDVAKGLYYLHHLCDPAVIHGDIKPSNVLLDGGFGAKVGDFGLAKFKMEDNIILEPEGVVENESLKKGCEDNMSIVEESESLVNGFEEGTENNVEVVNSPESCVKRVVESEATSAEVVVVSPEVGSLNERGIDKVSVESSGKDVSVNNGGEKKGTSRKDWWWRQDNIGESKSGKVKDYVMEWIGSEINKERPNACTREWVASPSSMMGRETEIKNEPKRRGKRGFGWWASLDEDRMRKKEKNRKPREWWKEEFCEELSKKRRRKERKSSNGMEIWWEGDDDLEQQRKQRKSKSRRSSLDRWLDGLSGELRNNGRRNSLDWGCIGDIPKSGGVSSTPSMRGTVCYIAPEYGGGGQLSEKCDVYSYGVLLLVLVSGRRPLQVTASPISEFERANLISWARQLAHNGKLLDLVDQSIHSLDKDQALLCITIALLCLQRSPNKRPTMKEVLGMLEGESEPPQLPFEFSPSPPSNFAFKSRQNAR